MTAGRRQHYSVSEEMPFHNIVDYDIEIEFETSKMRIEKLMEDNGLKEFIKKHTLSNFISFESSSGNYLDENSFLNLNREGPNFLNVFSLNIVSLPKHGGELLNFLDILRMQFNVIILSEIGARNISSMEHLIPDFTFHYVLPIGNNYGGIGIYLSNEISNVCIMEELSLKKSCACSNCNFESLFINCNFYGKQFTIGGIYNHPRGHINHFNTALEFSLSKIESGRTAVLAGDMNINLIDYDKTIVLNYLTMLLSHKYEPCICYPTRITPHSATCIDHIFIRKSRNNMYSELLSGILYCDISDHLPCFASLKINKTFVDDRPYIRLFGKLNENKFKQQMEVTAWNNLYTNSENYYSSFFLKLKPLFDRAFPIVRLSKKRQHDRPWVTRGLKLSIQHNHRLYRYYLRRPTCNNQMKYKKYNKILRKCLNKAETNYFEQLFLDNRNASYKLWKHLGPILNPAKKRKSQSINKLMNQHGELISEPHIISNILNDFFCNIGPELQENLPSFDKDNFKKYLPPSILNSFYLSPVTKEEIVREIKLLKINKACGEDGIGAKILQICPDVFAFNLEIILNKCIELGEYPTELKIAKVVALFKKGQKHIANNYRPISLLACIDKIFERLICRQLVNFCEINNIFYNSQFGFRKLFSTSLALIEFTDSIRCLVDEGNYVFSLFVDLTKAFDTVDHEILLSKLSHYGIRGHANNFFRSYLSNRKQFTVVGGSKSMLGNIKCGVPQGSVLGPVLFLIYINDLYMCNENCKIKMFADDTCLTVYGKTIDEVLLDGQAKSTDLFEWCLYNKLTVNADKTCFMIFHSRKRHVPNNVTSITINEKVIKIVSSVKYLGLIFDESLTWNEHVNSLCNSLLKYFGIFNQVKHFINKRLARQIYFAFIYSRIRYGIETYGSCSEKLINKIQIIQNKLMKMLLGLNPRTSTNRLHMYMNVLKVKDLYKVNILDFVNSCITGKCPDSFNNYFIERESNYNIRNIGLYVKRCNTDIGSSAVCTFGAKLWNGLNTDLKQHSHKLSFRKHLVKFFINYTE